MEKLVNDLFEDLGLTIGGLVAIHELPDAFVWRLFRTLDELRLKAVRRADGSVSHQPSLVSGFEPHPAVEEFLRKLRRT
jgi:hypothetical protein